MRSLAVRHPNTHRLGEIAACWVNHRTVRATARRTTTSSRSRTERLYNAVRHQTARDNPRPCNARSMCHITNRLVRGGKKEPQGSAQLRKRACSRRGSSSSKTYATHRISTKTSRARPCHRRQVAAICCCTILPTRRPTAPHSASCPRHPIPTAPNAHGEVVHIGR